MRSLSLGLLVQCVAIAAADSWQSKSLDDLFKQYDTIFPHGNRNAASHRWATFVLDRSADLTPSTIEYFFSGFCPVSGSPITPLPQSTWLYQSFPSMVDASGTDGVLHHCCWPCVCDTLSFLKVDTKTIKTANGNHKFNFVVYGNPCGSADKIPKEAPDVTCTGDKLDKATYSDGGHVIVGMLESAPAGGKYNKVSSVNAQCQERAKSGFQSGMGKIFIDIAKIKPLTTPSAAATIGSGSRPQQLARTVTRSEVDAVVDEAFAAESVDATQSVETDQLQPSSPETTTSMSMIGGICLLAMVVGVTAFTVVKERQNSRRETGEEATAMLGAAELSELAKAA